MGFSLYRYLITPVDFAGLSTRGIRMQVLDANGLAASLYGDYAMLSTLANPIIIDESGVAAFYTDSPMVDVVMVDAVRGRCLVRGLSTTDHKVTFEPDNAGSKLLGSAASWSGDPYIVDLITATPGYVPISKPIFVDFGQVLVGDVIRIRSCIVTEITGKSAPSYYPDFRLAIGGDELQNVSFNSGNYSTDGVHPTWVEIDLVIVQTGVNGRVQSSASIIATVKPDEVYYYYNRTETTVIGGPDGVEGLDLHGTQEIRWTCSTNAEFASAAMVYVPVMSVELIRA